MEQSNFDAMFEDMLGELDIISQQLEDKSEKKEVPKSNLSQNRESTSSHFSAAANDEADIDLNAMLNDITDWEQSLAPTPKVNVEFTSDTDQDEHHDRDRGSGLNSNSLSQDSNKLSHCLDVSPQFNTLKRSMTDGPSVTFDNNDDDDLSLASLEKDIEMENRKKDKSRQLSAEELSALSPVMQELDDLVSDLSNLSFEHHFGFEGKASNKDENEQAQAQSGTIDAMGALMCKTKVLNSQDDTLSESSTETREIVVISEHQPQESNRETLNNQQGECRVGLQQSVVTEERDSGCKDVILNHNRANFDDSQLLNTASSPKSKTMVLKAAKHFENEVRSQQTRNTQFSGLEKPPPRRANNFSNVPFPSKPPVPPPTASKPKLPEKPQTINFNVAHRQRTASTPVISKTTTPVKRQLSVKAPANLTNILERQLRQHSPSGDKQPSPTGAFQGVARSPSFPSASAAPYVEEIQRQRSLIRQNSTEARRLSSEPQYLGRKHSTSLVSVESNFSTTGSVTSVKSNSSADSSASDFSRHSMEYTNNKSVPEDIKMFIDGLQKQNDVEQVMPEAREERIRAEKMRIALEKLKEARIQKLVVKVFNKDDSSKTLMVDERMTARSVIKQLLEKNHYEPSVNWALVEELPSLFMERIFEEHESVTEMLSYWTRDTTNQVRFLERKDKYALFRNPQHYLLSVSDTEGQMAERQKQTLIEEFFSGRSGSGVPEVQGILYIKGESKSWSRKFCVLRNSGLYCSKSGEPKKGKKVSDLHCLIMFEQICVYLGRGWKKKHKSPTDYGFALKHPAIQTKSKHIRYFCCDDVRSLMRWIVGIRCAKYGKQLKDNFDKTATEMKSFGEVPTMPYRAPQPDTTSNASGDSAESENKPAVPRASITNMFGAAWERANQQESSEVNVEQGGGLKRGKSVWNPSQTTTSSSNWWDLGATPELEELAVSTRTSDSANSSTTRNEDRKLSSSDLEDPQVHAATSPSAYSNNTAPPPLYKPSYPPTKPNPAAPQRVPFHSAATAKGPPPPPPAKNFPPALPAKTIGIRPMMPQANFPPSPGPKPVFKPSSGPMLPPPPPMDDLPPPPPMDDMPLPPPMDDLPPPLDDDMPLPPPMELSPNPGLPKGLRGVGGQAPVRLPFLPMFKNGNPMANLRHTAPNRRPHGPPPHSTGNFNSSNNKPPMLPRSTQNQETQMKSSGMQSWGGYNHTVKAGMQPPLMDYYASAVKQDKNALYSKKSLPPPPDFVSDLKDTFYHVAVNSASDSLVDNDLPPPPSDLLLNEVRSRRPYAVSKNVKSAPPPPRRSPSTKLSFKR